MRATEHNGHRPNGGGNDVERALRQRLAEDRHIDDSTVLVSFDDGKATIAGQVPDRDTFERVHALVARAAGVHEIDNVLTIAPAKQQRKDHDVVRQLQAKLEDDFPSSQVDVTLVGSTAVLEGSAGHEQERAEIERMVQGHAHVDRTVNHIRIV